MKRFAANYIFPITSAPIKNGVIEVDDNGQITNIFEQGGNFQEIHSTQFFNGVIVPGFVNAHCHLELSHLKGMKPNKPGIAGFIEAVTTQRKVSDEFIHKCIEDSLKEAYQVGTSAIGDICNTTDTLPHKLESKIEFFNFVELFGIDPAVAQNTFENGIRVLNQFKKHFPKQSSLTPHSTYSLSKPLWNHIHNHLKSEEIKRASIHYGESKAEYEFLESGSGPLYNRYKGSKINFEVPNNLTPAQIVINNIPPHVKLLLIHNTFSQADEIKLLSEQYSNLTLVTCPESNQIIEKTLPELSKFKDLKVNIAIGTDSLASATSLSMLNQINIILDNFNDIDFETALSWATINGAKALGFNSKLGSIEKGKSPGLVLITNFDFKNMKPTKDSIAQRLI
ncbi:MAG: aminodeoxyfutalosine deaminase [Tenuifilum sp.]|jgi:cytosine/adenosine deaminase-related metal-dependent hydrolase|uniref:amidohydrolase family protein n=1 Tax=Tenuifilum sp. TaxID=2760880 RepID=UPI0024AA11CD|nr:amidohydrolase family protein [Tenuifilum sp.]MDI3526336.1 aminodeoxyfutalosine deaminase [Tenuifilum sp.]